MSAGRRTRKPALVEVKVRRPTRTRSRSGGRVGAPVGFAVAGLGLAGIVLLGGPFALLWLAGGCGALSAGSAFYQHRRETRTFRAATRAQRDRAEQARLARIRRERERTLDRQSREQAQAARPQVGPDSRITTPPGCTPACYGASKPDPEGQCSCPCNGSHHGEGYRLRRERAVARRKANRPTRG